MKPKLKLKLEQKISILVVILVILSVAASITAAGFWNVSKLEDELERNALNVVQITAISPIVIDGLENPGEVNLIQPFIEKTQALSQDIDIMVVADVNGIRYGHTKEDRVGKAFSAEDHVRAVTEGETYVSIGPGTLGPSLRAFTPVKNAEGEILGFVMAGSLLDSVKQAKADNIKIMALFVVLGTLLGLLGAFYVSRKIKKSLLGYEPEDIARLYLENQGILATVHEGIIAVDGEHTITLVNKRCMELLGIEQESIKGAKIDEVFPQSKLPQAVDSGESILDYQYALGDVIVLSNNIPLMSNDQVIGGVSSFRDQTEVAKMAEEMTGVQKIVDSLRATTHEFKNKLHIILGFLETDRSREAKQYIAQINEDLQNSVSSILNQIKETTIAALLIGKFNRGMELKIHSELSEDSFFDNNQKLDINSIVVILGNLIDNAMDNLDAVDQEEKSILIKILDHPNHLYITVTDNGSGIFNTEVIFQKGFTTKEGNRGYGLYLVRENVEKYGGSVNVKSNPGSGSTFIIDISKGEA